MSKQPTRGHISVKGEVYVAFREACHSSNLSMGKVLDGLINSALDCDEDFFVPIREPAHEGFEITMVDLPPGFAVDDIGEKRPIDKPTVAPEQVLAEFFHAFNKSPAQEAEPDLLIDKPEFPKADIERFDRLTKNPYADDSTELESFTAKVTYAEAVAESVVKETQAPGLFSEEGLRQAEAEPNVAPAPRSARGSSPPVNADDIPSFIDPTFGRK